MATATACANIAFIKYWGNRPGGLNLPLNPSISMALAGCVTVTTVETRPDAATDELALAGRAPDEKSCARIGRFLDVIRQRAGRRDRLRVDSSNSFPMGCGIASSASGFAALALAAARALGMNPDPPELSRLARLGSGSAARSAMGGFVELHPGVRHEEAFAEQIAPESAWPELRDVIVILSGEEKAVSSAEGHGLAHTSEMFAGRLQAIPARAERVRRGIRNRDLALLGEAAEEDALSMHAVMMTSRPPLLYWSAQTVGVIHGVWALRKRGVEAYFTIDAGPNVHVITLDRHVDTVAQAIGEEFPCRLRIDRPGPGAHVVGPGS